LRDPQISNEPSKLLIDAPIAAGVHFLYPAPSISPL
jgi:hypothetical protein